MASQKQIARNQANSNGVTTRLAEASTCPLLARYLPIRDSAGNSAGETVPRTNENSQTNLDFDKPHRIKLLHGNWDTWRLHRLRAVEVNMYALGAQDAETKFALLIARANDFKGLTYKAPAWPSRSGSVFPNGSSGIKGHQS